MGRDAPRAGTTAAVLKQVQYGGGSHRAAEHAERVLSMQRQRRQVHDKERKGVDRANHTVDVGSLRNQQNSSAHK